MEAQLSPQQEAQVREIKLAALRRISELGMTPAEVGAMVKAAAAGVEKQANALQSLLWPLGFLTQQVGNTLSTAKGVGQAGVIGAIGLPLAAGYGTGYLGEKVLGPNDTDVEQAREESRIERLRRATIRTNAESHATEDTDDDRRKRRQALTILSAV